MLSRQSYSFLLQVGNITTELCYGLIKVSHLNTTIVVDFPLLAAPASRGLAKFSCSRLISPGDPRSRSSIPEPTIDWPAVGSPGALILKSVGNLGTRMATFLLFFPANKWNIGKMDQVTGPSYASIGLLG